MCAFNERLWPNLASDHSAEVGCIKENFRANFICNRTHLSDWVMEQVQRSTDSNQLRLYFVSKFAQRIDIDCVTGLIDRR